jgi:hypothetical protein
MNPGGQLPERFKLAEKRLAVCHLLPGRYTCQIMNEYDIITPFNPFSCIVKFIAGKGTK